MKNRLNELNSLLKTRIHEHEMLNLSLAEMYQRSSSEDSINAMKKVISDLEDEIRGIQEDINSTASIKPSKVSYSFYDNIKKEKHDEPKAKEINLYDSVMKSDKISDDDEKLNYDYDFDIKSLLDISSVNNQTSLSYSNRFLVRFEGNGLKDIPEWIIKGVDYNTKDRKEIIIRINDFLIRKENKKIPLIALLNNSDSSFNVLVDHLDPTGLLIYRERYHGCSITDIFRSSLDYSSDEINTIYATISYSDSTYETSH